MPIILTRAYQPGDADKQAAKGYPMAQLTTFIHNPLTMGVYIEYQFGTATGDHYEVWQKGAGSPTLNVDVGFEDVLQMWGQPPKDGECVGQAIRRLTYQYLIDKKLAVGTIADAPPLTQAQVQAASDSADQAATDDNSANDGVIPAAS